MNDPSEKHTALAKRVGQAAVVFISLHVLLAAIALWAPRSVVYGNPVTKLYRKLILVGPFFSERAIKTSGHLTVQYKSGNEWSLPRDHAAEGMLDFSTRPWAYAKLRTGAFERYLLAATANQKMKTGLTKAIETSKAFHELNQFVVREYLIRQHPGANVDSIKLLYTWKTYLSVGKTYQIDTAFLFTYNPKTIAPAKK